MMKSCAFACFAAASTLKRNACSSSSPSTYNKKKGEGDRKGRSIARSKDGREGCVCVGDRTGHRIAMKDSSLLFTHIFIDPICNIIRDGACNNMG